MNTQTVYVQVPVSERLPYHDVLAGTAIDVVTDMGFIYSAWLRQDGTFERIDTLYTDEVVTHWLEKQEAIVLTPQQYEERMVGFVSWINRGYWWSNAEKCYFVFNDKDNTGYDLKEILELYTEELKNKA